MEEALTYAGSAAFIVAVVQLIRMAVPWIDGIAVPPMVLCVTSLWGGLLAYTGRWAGDPAEFVVVTVTVAAAAIGLHSTVKTGIAARDGTT